MYLDFSSIFHGSSKDLSDKGRVYISSNSDDWPEEWKTISYKEYPRCAKIRLEQHMLRGDINDFTQRRHSTRSFSGKPVDLTTLSTFLQHACGLQEAHREFPARTYPSGGGRFPIEVYPLIFSGSADIPAGVYHYNVKDHALESLWQRDFTATDIAQLFTYEWIQKASFALVMTAVFARNQVKYGERGYRYVLLEAGHLGENAYLAAAALGLGCCGMGGMRDAHIEKLLDIDGISESVVHSIIVGKRA